MATQYTLPNRPTIWPDYSLTYKPNAFSMPIDYVAVVGTPSRRIFHFRLSLVSQGTRESVRIDMKPQSESLVGVAKVEYNNYLYSSNFGPAPFLVRVAPGTTVATILKIIFDEERMDQYMFEPPGLGCRHWCASVLEKLVGRHLVHHSTMVMFENSEMEAYAEYKDEYPMPRIKGRFYP